jgi:hypothetical protein
MKSHNPWNQGSDNFPFVLVQDFRPFFFVVFQIPNRVPDKTIGARLRVRAKRTFGDDLRILIINHLLRITALFLKGEIGVILNKRTTYRLKPTSAYRKVKQNTLRPYNYEMLHI